jgi:RNA-directed DNA polymerase
MSFEGRAYAVRKVTSNDGKKTPGVDNKIWKGTTAKTKAISELRKVVISPKSYKPQNIRKVLIPKPNSNEQRPLGIPTMLDRALQTLIVLALDPIVEERSDKYSYGSRKHRSTHDAIHRLFQLLSRADAPKWILDVDISKCFDNISHDFVNKEIKQISCGIGKTFIKRWLKAGIVFKGSTYYPEKGIPQAGVVSPMLCNLVLNGIDELIRPGQPKHGTQKHKELACCWAVRYVDDIIITGPTEDKLRNYYLPKLNEFLKERGLEISESKSRIINFKSESFEYLGWKFELRERDLRYNKVSSNKLVLIIKPTQKANRRIRYVIKSVFRTQISMIAMIKKLNPIIRGWTNYYRRSPHSQGDFARLSNYIYTLWWIWSGKIHPYKSKRWRKRKYIFHNSGTKRWQIGYNSKIIILDPVTVKTKKTVVLQTDRNPLYG